VKLKLTPAGHKNVHMAAAEREMTIADFLRESVFSGAGQAVKKHDQREPAPQGSRRSSPSEQ